LNRIWQITVGILFFSCGSLCGQDVDFAQRNDSPPELAVLIHKRSFERRFVNDSAPKPRNGKDEPTTQVAGKSVMIVSVNVRSNTPKQIIGISWQFIVATRNEEYFRIPFITAVEIDPRKTRTIKGEIESLPRGHPHPVTVDELEHPDKTPAQERIVINCVLFSDGTFSALNDGASLDCRQLQASPQIRKRLQKL